MKVIGGLLTAVVLLGTSGATAGNPVGCAYEGESGICVTFGEAATALDPKALETIYLQAARDVEERYGLDLRRLPAPSVRVIGLTAFRRVHRIAPRLDGDTAGDHGWTEFDAGRITITGPAVMRHEAFHYILWRTGYPDVLNAAHEHPVFDEYRDGRWLPRRTVAAGSSSPTP